MLRHDQVVCWSLDFNWAVLYVNKNTFDYTIFNSDLGTIRLAQVLRQNKYCSLGGTDIIVT